MVKAGRNDSVASIARRYKLSPANVAEWNDVKPNHAFQRGYQVVVYLPVRSAPARARGQRRAARHGSTVVMTGKRGGGVVKTSTAASGSRRSSQQVVREKRGGTPSKKKR